MTINEDILEYAARMQCQELHMVTDEKTGLKAVIAIHNTQLGPALGGCRWIEYSSTQQAAIDAIRLAQGMTYKSAISKLPLGGGKAVLLKPKTAVVDRVAYFQAFGRFLEKLNGRYITAVDVGTTIEDMDVIATQTSYVTSISNSSFSSPNPSPLTAYGVKRGIEAVAKYYFKKDNLQDLHVVIQGVGHVGYQLAKNLVAANARVSVGDVNPDAVKRCVQDFGVEVVEDVNNIHAEPCDIFAPCALGAILNDHTIPKIKAPVVAGAANNQLELPDANVRMMTEKGILYAPDFVINAGGIIYVAGQHIQHSEAETREKIGNIYDTLLEIFNYAEQSGLSTYQVAHDLAIKQVNKNNGGVR